MNDIIELLEARTKLKHNYPADRDVLKQASDEILRLREALKRVADRDEERRRPIRLVGSEAVREIVRLREELAEYKRKGIVDVTGSMNYHSGYDDGAREERYRCVRIAEQARDDTCDGPVAWSMADGIAAAIRESGDE